MAQGVLPFKYEEEKRDTGMTALAGLPVYMDLASAMGMHESIERHLHIKQQGWTDRQTLMSLILMNLAGGDCVNDLVKLEGDSGFCRVLRRIEQRGMKRRERREMDRRWRKEQGRTVPSPSAVFRYLSAFHDANQEKLRAESDKKAFIPAPNENLQGLARVNGDMVCYVQRQNPLKVATLDQDATLVETTKLDALYSYKGYRAYQPLNTWWAEQELVLHTEFRDGNVPAGYEQLRVFKEALAMLPEGVEKVCLRSDTAGYQHDLLRYCEKGENERFGRIEFAIGCDVTLEFKKAALETGDKDWQSIYKEFNGHRMKTNQEWAEVCFIPAAIGYSKSSPVYRYLAIREVIGSMELPGMEMPQQSFPFPTMQVSSQRYKLFGLVTNMDWAGEKLIHWHRERCGKSEEAHSVMKEDLAGGKLPSDDFGENAAWWWIMILAMNLNSSMKRLALGESWIPRRMKAIRFSFINIPGRIIERSRELIIRLVKGNSAINLLLEARIRIMALAGAPSG
ncbi:IS1380 family transposase [Shewanella vesiculosa]|uniref:IS1380 family transposase n=1 Tax=Shewanella vesiculosa TaxID=518738 RepID=UPI0023581C91|nr:IS1380 family transposase [Shewanella vesiculosa]NCP76476.1 IS1380 family transposase [Shewanella vesiculosa]